MKPKSYSLVEGNRTIVLGKKIPDRNSPHYLILIHLSIPDVKQQSIAVVTQNVPMLIFTLPTVDVSVRVVVWVRLVLCCFQTSLPLAALMVIFVQLHKCHSPQRKEQAVSSVKSINQ